jgi:S1-C subfamily serine protease
MTFSAEQRPRLSAMLWLCCAATALAGDESPNMAKSVEGKLQSVYNAVSPAVVKIRSQDATDQRMIAVGVIVSPEGHVLMRGTSELSTQFRGRQPILFTLHDGRQIKGFPLGWSNEWRVALAKIADDGTYPYVKIAKQPNLKPGQICVALEFAHIIGGNERELQPHMQIGCVTSVAPHNWFRTSCRVDEFPAVFDLDGCLIGMTTVKPYSEDSFCTTADIINELWSELNDGRNVDVERLGGGSGNTARKPRGSSSQPDVKWDGKTVPPAIEKAAAATVRIRGTAEKKGGWSGVIISKDGFIATCAHHRKLPGESVVVLLPDGRDLRGKVLGNSAVADVSLLKITEEAPLPFVELGQSTTMHDGDFCWFTGFPARRQDRTPLLRYLRIADRDELPWSCVLYTQKDSGSGGGVSGGGLFDSAGKLIAIHEGQNAGDFGRHRRAELFRTQWDYLVEGMPVQVIEGEPLKELTEVFDGGTHVTPGIVAEVLCVGQRQVLGTIVDACGLILTKWTELRGPVTVRMSSGKTWPATIVKFSRAHDLALLKIDADNLPTAKWVDRRDHPPGTLAVALLPSDEMRVGIVSRRLRSIPADRGGGLGNVIDTSEGLKVADELWSRSFDLPLKKGDIIATVDGNATPTVESLLALFGDSNKPGKLFAYAGDPISVVVRREKSTLNLRMPLSASSWPRPDGESRRYSGFPSVFDTDAKLTPEQCGAPLIDRHGHVLGVAIACRRVGQTHVVPATTAQRFISE